MSLDQKEESIGRIIAKVRHTYYDTSFKINAMKVQDDLQYLRAAANRGFVADDGDKSTDMKTVDMVIARTELGIQAVAERVLQSTHDHISTLPAVARKGKSKDIHIRHKKHRWVFTSVNHYSDDKIALQENTKL